MTASVQDLSFVCVYVRRLGAILVSVLAEDIWDIVFRLVFVEKISLNLGALGVQETTRLVGTLRDELVIIVVSEALWGEAGL